MRYDLKLIYDIEDSTKLVTIIFDRIYEVRRDEPHKIYDARFKNKELTDLPNYMQSVGIQNIIKNIWKN
jgi:hypothetical protein